MKIEILDWTDNPMDVIALVAGTSTGHIDTKHKRVKQCYQRGHMGVFEHAYITFYIEGISRACSHQLVRHRMASFVQRSQRYTKVEGDDWYVMPPAFEYENNRSFFSFYQRTMDKYKYAYDLALKEGIKPEDARFLLPEAAKTDITMTMNVRELFHFLDLRTDKAAQWEIRELANKMIAEIKIINEQWVQIIELWEQKHD